MDTATFNANKEAIDAANDSIEKETKDLMAPFYAGGKLFDNFKAEKPDANGNYDWSKAESIWAEGNITGIRDAILGGDSKKAQTIYDNVLASINNNNGLNTQQRQAELDKFNDYINKLTAAAEKKQSIVAQQASGLTYTSLTGSSM